MRSIKKLVGRVLIAFGTIAASVAALPQNALALGWDPQSMISSSTGGLGISTGNINQATLASWVQNITTWILGIAIVIFVARVVLTAVDKMLEGPGGKSTTDGTRQGTGGGTVLQSIPFIGAYPTGTKWGEVFKNFGKNLAIVVGAWVLVQIVVGVVVFVFGAITNGAV